MSRCIYDRCQFNDHIEIRVMKEYGVLESWTKFIVSMPGNVDLFSPICQLGDEEVAFLEDDTKLVLYNLKEETSRDMVVPGMMNMYYCGIMTFSGSLVSPSFCRWDEET
ncbi:hypothetical protein ACH5RR_033474 [Cinchona calisaya]|uniref:Uncharacterized protein n=1 Tax=Cinchona calisaya TaxID=153742 RepID=A0ABD2YL29_9GENT